MQKTFGYIRVSTDRQEQEGISLENQKAKIEQYCELNDLELLEVFSDSQSGKNLNREQFQRMISRLNEVNHIVTYKLDRISRKTIDVLNLIEEFDKKSISLHSVVEKLDTQSAIGRFVLRTLSSLAEMERDLIGERTKDALAKVKEHKPLGAPAFGQSQVFQDSKRTNFEVNSKELEAIENIIKLRKEGSKLDDIKRYLENNGIPTKRGKLEWNVGTIQRILKANSC